MHLIAMAGGIASGLAGTVTPLLLLAPVGLVAAVWTAVRFSEFILLVFLTAGTLKQDPLLAGLPVDATLLAAALVALAVLWRSIRGTMVCPREVWLLLPIFVAMALSLVHGVTEYGSEKAIRFCTLTLLAILAGITLLAEGQRLRRYLNSVALLSFFMILYALATPGSVVEGRLTLHGSNPIALAQKAAFALAFAWLRLHFTRSIFERGWAMAILAVASYGLLAAGSRGPSVSLAVSMTFISLVTTFAHKRSPLSIWILIFIVASVVFAISYGSIPARSLGRYELLWSDNKGVSVYSRGIIWLTAWNLMLSHPLGVGAGGFAKYAIADFRYPHNLFLEVGSELGWLPLLALLAFVALSVRNLVTILRAEYSFTTTYLGVVVLVPLANSMVSADLNDNRTLFVALLLPFLYRRAQLQHLRESGATASGLARSTSLGGM